MCIYMYMYRIWFMDTAQLVEMLWLEIQILQVYSLSLWTLIVGYCTMYIHVCFPWEVAPQMSS